MRRERVPFVLTHDFVYVINKGCVDREAKEFSNFQALCERVSCRLRKHIPRYLFIIIFIALGIFNFTQTRLPYIVTILHDDFYGTAGTVLREGFELFT